MVNIILQELKKNTGSYVSGESLSRTMGVSRTAVWKEIEKLKEAGYSIASSSRKGYRLDESPDLLTYDELECELESSQQNDETGKQNSENSHLNQNYRKWKIISLETVDSTNTYAKKAAAEDEDNCDRMLVIAEEQTAGRGRLGRAWVSRKGLGIWMSLVLRPNLLPEKSQMVTMVAGLSAAQAVNKLSGLDCGIKWPNDIIIDGRKICGILTEINAELERIHYLVVGIGININHKPEDFPPELRNIAVSLSQLLPPGVNLKRSRLVKEFLAAFDRNYEIFFAGVNRGDCSAFIEEYRKHSVTIGREVRIVQGETEYTAFAQDISENGKLIVKCKSGEIREIYSGEVSVRGLLGYS